MILLVLLFCLFWFILKVPILKAVIIERFSSHVGCFPALGPFPCIKLGA